MRRINMIFNKIQEIISEQFGLDLDDVEMGSRLYNDIGAEDVDIIELLMHVEEEFDISIPEEDADTMKTVADIVEYVKQNK